MKRILFAILAIITHQFAIAQTFTLSGTSYTQNFDAIGTGLPNGWRVDSLVNKNAGLGNNAISRFSTTQTAWSSVSRGFRNVASADSLVSTSPSADQNASTDRALGMRQVSAAGWDDKDSLISVSFGITSTTGLSGFALEFKIQSLHTAAKRYNNWIVQYGLGANPTSFTTLTTTPSTITIDSNFSNTLVTVNFGSVLDNQSQPVWIRIMPNDTTMGGGNRPHVAIDDFLLTWTGTAVNNTPQVVSYTPPAGATNVPVTTTSLQITFDKTMSIGTGNVVLNNISDGTNQTIAASSCSASGSVVTIPGVLLSIGKNYAVQYDSTAFKWTTFSCVGVYDNTTWTFTTSTPPPTPVTSLNESFVGCNAPLLGSFAQFSPVGAQTWRCSNFGRNDTDAVYMNGFASGSSNDNEDWLISPPLDFSASVAPYLHFWSKKRFTGTNTKEVLVSSNFSGDPLTATWTPLTVNLSTLDTAYKLYNNTSLAAYKSSVFHIAFKYVSQASGSSDEWSVDDVFVTDGTVGVSNFENAGILAYVAGQASDVVTLVISDKVASNYSVQIIDMYGRVVSQNTIQSSGAKNKYLFDTKALHAGMYTILLQNDRAKTALKFLKH